MRVVVASAGTGKTGYLVRRYLEALRELPPRRIAAVTFTNLAAGELKARIYQAVQELPSYRHLGAELMQAPIGTIHTLLAQLLRLAAPELGLDPEFRPLAPGVAQTWFLEAARALALSEGTALAAEEEELLLQLFRSRTLAHEFRPLSEASRSLLERYQRVLARWEARLAGRFLDPGELERKALLLTRQPQALQRIAQRLRLILVDEHQDTSPLQAELFQILASQGIDLEVVGDPKQSIYSFRNATPEGFLAALEEAEQRGEVLRLKTSYRHSRALCAVLNRFVAQEGRRGVAFPASAALEVEGSRPDEGQVECYEVVGASSCEELRAQEAELAALRLLAWRREGVAYGRMRVLVRRRTSLPPLLAALRRVSVPYVVFSDRGLKEEPELTELHSALLVGFLGQEAPSEAWMTLLTGPFVGLPVLLAARLLAEKDRLAALEASNPSAAQRLRELLEACQRPAGQALVELLSLRWGFLERTSSEIADTLRLLASRWSSATSHPEILRALEELQEEEGSLVAWQGEAVQVTTIHGAKGLEAEAVLLFDMGRRSPPRRPKVAIEPGSGRMALEDDPGYAELAELWQTRQRAEDRRLLYVAFSRARDRLLITASRKEGRSWLEEEGLGDLKPYLRYREISAKTLEGLREKYASTPESPAQEPEARTELPPAVCPRPRLLSPSRLRREDPPDLEGPVLDPEARLRAQAVGILVHSGIQLSWPKELPALEAILGGEQIVREFPPEERPSLIQEVGELLASYWSLLERELVPLAERQKDYAELPWVLQLPDGIWEGVIDRLYYARGTWVLEDYKTDREVHPEAYAAQLALYREAVRRTLNVEPRVRLVFLRPARVIELGPQDLAAGWAQLQIEP